MRVLVYDDDDGDDDASADGLLFENLLLDTVLFFPNADCWCCDLLRSCSQNIKPIAAPASSSLALVWFRFAESCCCCFSWCCWCCSTGASTLLLLTSSFLFVSSFLVPSMLTSCCWHKIVRQLKRYQVLPATSRCSAGASAALRWRLLLLIATDDIGDPLVCCSCCSLMLLFLLLDLFGDIFNNLHRPRVLILVDDDMKNTMLLVLINDVFLLDIVIPDQFLSCCFLQLI